MTLASQAEVATPRHWWRPQGIRVFSSAVAALRLRRPTDVLMLALAVLLVLLLVLVAPGPGKFDRRFTDLLQHNGSIWDWAWGMAFAVVFIWPVVLLIMALTTKGRRRLVLDSLVAIMIAGALAVIAGRVGGTDLSTVLRSVDSTGPPQVFPAVRLALAASVIVTASPHVTRPFRRVGRLVLLLGVMSGVALGMAYPVGSLAGFAVGLAAGSITHLLFGCPDGGLTEGEVLTALAELDCPVSDVTAAPIQSAGTQQLDAIGPDGHPVLVKIYGRDAWDNEFLASLWASIVRRGERPRLGRSRRSQVEHEAVTTLLAQRAGVPVLSVRTVGTSVEDDAILVTERRGTPLSTLGADIDDDRLTATWHALVLLQGARIAHGRIGLDRVMAFDDGGIALSDFGLGRLAASVDAMTTDRAQLLVATAAAVGPARAIAIARDQLGSDGLAEVLSYLQPAALDGSTRRTVRDRHLDLTQLRADAAAAAGVPVPSLERLRRVTWKSVAIAVAGTLFAYVLISKLVNVDYSSIINELSSADWAWVGAALVVSPVVAVALSFSTIGASAKELRYLPVLMLQYAIQFMALAVPSSAARLALEVRFFQRFGLPAAGALSISVIDSLSALVVQLSLIAVIGLTALPGLTSTIGGSSAASSDSSGHPVVALVIIVVALVAVSIATSLAVPWSRRRIKVAVDRARETIKEQAQSARAALVVLRQPAKLGQMLGGNLSAQVIQGVILGLCLEAFGSHAHLSQLILVNTLVSLFAGFMPVPGGVGVAEAGYVACLQAIGVPSTVAISAALLYRMVTFYLPPLWGSVAAGWLRRHQYI